MSRTVIVTGSREWTDEPLILRVLDAVKPTLLVEGGAKGADSIARAWANARGVECRTMHADWQKHMRPNGKNPAGLIRNVEMLRAYPTAWVLAFPLDGPGTKHCVIEARKRGMHVSVFGVGGTVLEYAASPCTECHNTGGHKMSCSLGRR